MSKVKCIDCYLNRGTICKVGNTDIFNTKKARNCKDFDPVSVQVPTKSVRHPIISSSKVDEFFGEEACYRFHS